MANYGAGLNPFGKYEGYSIQQGGKYYAQNTSGFFSTPGRQLKVDQSGTPFSDFERQWYIDKGFGDPLKTKTEFYDSRGNLLKDGKYTYTTPVIKGQGGYSKTIDLNDPKSYGRGLYGSALPFGVRAKQVTQGVSPEARQLYMMATGGVDPVQANASGQQLGSKTILATSKFGEGTVQNVKAEQTIPTISDINIPMREQLSIMNRIRRA